MQTISVKPANGGWRVTSDAIANDLMFRRGKTAEQAAIRLAESASANGELVQINVHLFDGTIAKRFICPQVDLLSATSAIAWERGAVSA